MAHRIYRLSISPDDLPEVRRVIELDGRASLDDVHEQIVRHYRLDDSDHLYAFFISGRFWDKQTAYFDPRTDGARADRALLFRLNLTPGHVFAYLLDYGMENRFLVTVAAVREAENALAEPLLVETAGEVIEGSPDDSEDESDDAPPELAELVALAEAFLDAADELDELEGEPADLPDITGPVLQAAAAAALALLSAVDGDRQRFFQLDDWLIQRSLAARLLDLPLALTHVRAFEQAISLARALVFVDRELMEGDLAIVLAKAGRRDEALAQLDQNLSQAQDAVLVEAKAGETHRALADLPAAEAYFRRSLAEAKTKSERLEGMIRVASCLVDQGRDAEANEVLKAARDLEAESAEKPAIPVVGRNEPCPCGSGKKYKKCHGG